MRRIAARRRSGLVGDLMRSFGVGGFGLRVAGLVLLSRWEKKKRSTARQRPRPWGRVAVSFVEKNGAAAVMLVLIASLEVWHGAVQVTRFDLCR